MFDVADLVAHGPGISDKELLGDALQPEDYNADHVQGHDYYNWYFALGNLIKPRWIAEMGVRHGYSLISVVKGSLQSGWDPKALFAVGYDMDFRDEVAHQQLSSLGVPHKLVLTRMENLYTLRQDANRFDLIHVDADHSAVGIERELRLATGAVAADGYIVIDDMNSKIVAGAVDNLCCHTDKVERLDVPTIRGMAVLRLF